MEDTGILNDRYIADFVPAVPYTEKCERTTWIAPPSELVDAPPKVTSKAGVRLPPPLVRHPIAKGDQEKY